MAFVTDVELASNGRMVLPQEVRDAMGISGDTRLIVTVDGTEVRLSPVSTIVARLQTLYREHVTHDAGVDAFLTERRADDGPVPTADA